MPSARKPRKGRNPSRPGEAPGEKPQEGKAAASLGARTAEPALSGDRQRAAKYGPRRISRKTDLRAGVAPSRAGRNAPRAG